MRFQLLLGVVLPILAASCNLKRVCYFTNWAQYRNGAAKFTPSNIDANICTHIIYAFANIDADLKIKTFEWNDLTLYSEIMALKTQNPSLKVLIAVGGYGRSYQFTTMAAQTSSMTTFADNAVTFMRLHGFDGIDMDWEFPGDSNQKAAFTELMQIFRNKFDSESLGAGQETLLLTAAVSAGQYNIDRSYDIPAISGYSDFINVMTYDFAGVWNNPRIVRHHSPLYMHTGDTGQNAQFNADWAMNYWKSQGADPTKLILGLATYGRSFQLTDPSNTAPGSAFTGSASPGAFTGTSGFLSYFEICKLLETGGWTYVNDTVTKAPYAYGPSTGFTTEWVGYDDSESFKTKLQYVKDNGFGGAMVWSLSFDDFSGSFCSSSNVQFPLISQMADVLTCDNSTTPAPTPGTTQPPTTQPPTTQPPTTQPPTTQPPTTQPSTTPTTTTPTTTPRELATLAATCSDGSWFQAGLSSDCKTFYKCDNGKVVPFTCPGSLVYDVRYSVCNWPAAVPGCS